MAVLSAKQTRSLAALLSCKSVEEAAQKAGISSTTIFRWLRKDETFRLEYRKRRSQLMEETLRQLQGVCNLAIETLSQVMEDQEATAASRVTAAKTTLELSLKIQEHQDLAERIERLEEIIVRGKK